MATGQQIRSILIATVMLAIVGWLFLHAAAFAGQSQLPSGTLSPPTQADRATSPAPFGIGPQKQLDNSLEVPSLQLRAQPGYEQVTVTVTDAFGNYVTGLKKDDFQVIEDGQPRPVEFFRTDRTAPVSVGIVVDCSRSMNTKLPQAAKAIERLVDYLDAHDEVFLEAFSAKVALLQPFSVDHGQLKRRLKYLHAVTITSLYDAVLLGLNEMRLARCDKRVLVVITDGMDNASRSTRANVIAAARAMRILIYTIGIGDEAVAPQRGGFMDRLLTIDDDVVDMETLKALSEETGAKTFNLRRVDDGRELSRDCQIISNELPQQYALGYLSSDSERTGSRNLHVDLPKHPEFSVRTRRTVTAFTE